MIELLVKEEFKRSRKNSAAVLERFIDGREERSYRKKIPSQQQKTGIQEHCVSLDNLLYPQRISLIEILEE